MGKWRVRWVREENFEMLRRGGVEGGCQKGKVGGRGQEKINESGVTDRTSYVVGEGVWTRSNDWVGWCDSRSAKSGEELAYWGEDHRRLSQSVGKAKTWV